MKVHHPPILTRGGRFRIMVTMVGPLLAHESFELLNSGQDPIRGDLRYSRDAFPHKPVVIVCHSFMAFKDWGFFPRLGEQLAQRGFASITFNFSKNGVNGDGARITRMERFAANTFSQELADLGTVIEAVGEKRLGSGVIDSEKIVLLGHSRGGGIAIVRASFDRRVAALVSWSAVSTFDRWTAHQKERWRANGYLPLSRDTTASPLRLGITLLEDLEEHRSALSVLDAASRVAVPWLILHGEADVMVPHREAEALYAASARATTEYLLLEKVGHLYNAASETADSYRTLDGIIELTADWIHRNLTT